MARNVTTTINFAGLRALMNSAGVREEVERRAGEVAAVASSLQNELRAAVTTQNTTTGALGVSKISSRPATAIVFRGKGWSNSKGDQVVAGTPNSAKTAIGHFSTEGDA